MYSWQLSRGGVVSYEEYVSLPCDQESTMPARKQFQSNLTVGAQLSELLQDVQNTDVTEDVLREQRISFAFGNAPQSDLITKDSVRSSSQNIRLKQR